MGKKSKVGKARKDKFYQLAKETGFRARSAFKLLQLNRKYEFLQKARVCIDLCAAPGGWMQVAAQNMPVSSHIIGVDLVPIRPIPGTISLQEDITTEKCRQKLKKELQTWDADVVLNDGAPNVGKNWIHDAFVQAELTLAALKLATQFLRKGGWFITKVFRSRDYQSLMWVFGQLFSKVYATKPQASRNESAEIYVVCQGYYKPDKLDPKFLDPRDVFKEVDQGAKKSLNIIYPTKEKKRTEGYADGDTTLHHKLAATQFLESDNFLELLGDANQVLLDDARLASHEATTGEIRECLADIKVLGKKEIRSVISWRKKMKDFLAKESPPAANVPSEEDIEEIEAGSEDEEAKMDEQISALKAAEVKEAKKKRKQVMKEKRKLRDKMSLDMVIPGDKINTDEVELFSLKKIKSKQQLSQVAGQADMDDEHSEQSESDDDLAGKKRRVAYDRYADIVDETISESEEERESEEEEEADSEEEGSEEEEEDFEMDEISTKKGKNQGNPLVVEFEAKDVKAQRKMQMWFNKAAFSGLEEEEDEDLELEKMKEAYEKKGGVVLEAKSKKNKTKAAKEDRAEDEKELTEKKLKEDSSQKALAERVYNSDDDEESSSDESDSDVSDYDFDDNVISKQQPPGVTKTSGKDGFEIVPQHQAPRGKVRKLDAVGLALGEELVKSAKRRRELIEMSYNRYTFNDEGVPDWFSKDESRHMRPNLPITKEQVEQYKERMKAINARPIKKVAEAKARKKRKSMKQLEKARKKAEAVTDTVDVTEHEKWQQIRQIYKKAGLLTQKKRELTYVVAKRGVGKRVSRPAGVKGQFKVVDPRMKKDIRAQKNKEKTKGRSKRSRK